MTMPKYIIDMMETRTILRTIEAHIVQKRKNNEARPKFTGSYLKKACRNTDWAKKKIKTVPLVFYDMFMPVFEVMEKKNNFKNNLRTIEAQIVQNLRTTRLGQNLLVLIKKACILWNKKTYCNHWLESHCKPDNFGPMQQLQMFNTLSIASSLVALTCLLEGADTFLRYELVNVWHLS